MQKNKLILFTLCLGFFMVILDTTAVSVALPVISQSLHINISDLQWIVAGYTLSFASLLLLAGKFSDQLGAKPALLVGFIGFMTTSLACALAPTGLTLIIFRILQGASSTTLVPASLSLINSTFHDPKDRAKAIGIWGGVSGIAAASGPLIGAFLTEMLGWRSIFFINIPIAFVGILLIRHLFPSVKQPEAKTPIDWLGGILSVAFSFMLALALIEIGREGFLSFLVLGSAGCAVIFFAAFLYHQKRFHSPLVPLQIFQSKPFILSLMTGFNLNFAAYGQFFLLPLYFSEVRHYSVTQIGMAIFPAFLCIALASYLSGKVIARYGTRTPILWGKALGIIGYVGLGLCMHFEAPYTQMLFALACFGFGTAFVMPAATHMAIENMPSHQAGLASGIFTTARQTGNLAGVALLGSIVASAPDFVSGMEITLLISSVLYVFSFIANLNTFSKT